jgi:hypothetical protein
LYALFPKATRGLEPISYRGALLSTLLHATVYVFLHDLLNVLVQIANKMGLQKKSSDLRKKGILAVEASPHMGKCENYDDPCRGALI